MARLGRNSNICESDLRALHQDVSQWALYCTGFDHEHAREVVQQTYLKIVEGSAHFSGTSSLKTWLFGVVRLTALEAKRKQRGFESLDEETHAGALGIEATDTLHHERPGMSEMDRALGHLSLMQREIAYLVFYRDLPLAEVAGILGVSVGTVSKQYHRAKYRLAHLLGIGEEERGHGTIIEKTVS